MADHKKGGGARSQKQWQVPAGPEMEELLDARLSLGHIMNDTVPLTDRDFELIGKFVQTYCFADLEARRVINSMTHIRTGEPTEFSLKLNDKDALDHLLACADSCTWNAELAAGIRKAAEIFVQHRHLRHMFAHWAGRRIPNRDNFIFFTSSFGAQKIPTGAVTVEEHENANMLYGIMPISRLNEEQSKLQGHVQYLARMRGQLEARATEIAEHFSKDKAAGKF